MIILEKVFEKILYSSLMATVTVILVLFLKKVFKDKFTPRFHHIIWLLVLIRLLIPFAPESNLSLLNLLPNHNQSLSLEMIIPKFEESKPLVTRESTENTIQPKPTDDAKQKNYKKQLLQDKLKSEESIKDKNTNIFQRNLKLLSYIWAIGVLLISLFILTATFKFRKNVKSFDKIRCLETIHILHKCKEKLKLNRPIELYCGNDFESPFIFGILNTGIYIPKHILTKVDDKELSHILLHELSHYMRGDLLCNLLSTIAVILHWFNPVIWFAMKRMRSDIECACDSYVLENLGDSDSVDYGMTIIKLSSFISKSDHNKMLYAHFYESKDKIERRIILIKRFKKGTYKLSAIAMILFIALGCFTLTNARADINTASESAETIKTEQFSFEEPEKAFTTLDRAMDFIDFEFKVPDKLPQGCDNFDSIKYNGKEDLITISFRGHIKDPDSYYVPLLVSKNDIVEVLKGNKNNIKKVDKDPMKISDITGNCLTIYQHNPYNWSKEEINKVIKRSTKNVKELIPMKKMHKYFIWQDKDIWYCIPYYIETNFINDSDPGPAKNEIISKDDMKILVSSLKYPKDLQNIEYVSRYLKNSLHIYDNKDLKTAQEILGFTSKFPLNLPGGFIPTRSSIGPYDEILHNDELIEINGMVTKFQLKDKNSRPTFYFYQTKDTMEYDDIIQKGYINTKKEKIKVTSIMIDKIKVLTYNPNKKGIIKDYMWKQNGIIYKLSFYGDFDNQREIVKALINTP